MKLIENEKLTGERALFMSDGIEVKKCSFGDGESPLKHSCNVVASECSFEWKYPFWYCKNVSVEDSYFAEMARAGIWYTDNVKVKNCKIDAPKEFRRCDGVEIVDTSFTLAQETLWQCKNVKLENVTAKGDYFGMNTCNVTAENFNLEGNYPFDGSKDIVVKNSKLISKDAFWNSENITIYDSYICGEYFGWNSKNITLENCTVESLQGFCYIENLVMKNCRLENTTLAFEYSDVEAEITTEIDSIFNPSSGTVRCKGVKELILDETKIDPSKTKIIVE